MISNAQSTFNDYGIDKLKLGTSINEIPELVPFDKYKDSSLFNVYPSEKYFYFLNVKEVDELNIRYAVAIINDSGLIIKITFFIDDINDKVLGVLSNTFGRESTKSNSYVQEKILRSHYLWKTNHNINIYMIKSFAQDLSIDFPNTEIHFYLSNAFENFGDYSVDLKKF